MPLQIVDSRLLQSSGDCETIRPDQPFTFGACRAIWVGGAGNLEVLMEDSDRRQLFNNVPVGRFDIRATKVFSDRTTATLLVAQKIIMLGTISHTNHAGGCIRSDADGSPIYFRLGRHH